MRDPLDYRGGPLRYTEVSGADGWQLILNCAEEIADRYAARAASLDDAGRRDSERQARVLAGLHAQLAKEDEEWVRRQRALSWAERTIARQEEELERLRQEVRDYEQRFALARTDR